MTRHNIIFRFKSGENVYFIECQNLRGPTFHIEISKIVDIKRNQEPIYEVFAYITKKEDTFHIISSTEIEFPLTENSLQMIQPYIRELSDEILRQILLSS